MSEDKLYQKLVKIFGTDFVWTDKEILEDYAKDLSFAEGKVPRYVVLGRNTKDVEAVLKLANSDGLSIIPVSSSNPNRYHGDTLPRNDNTIILDLSRMNKILNLDKKNRVVMVEPGVTFGQIIPVLKKQGMKLLVPLLPRDGKSVLAAALERVPMIIPRYQWDSSDPLLCTEVVFGTGDLFRTGTAAGPGTVKQQQKRGAAQINPMGPTHFSPFRVVQGAQGSIGVATWVTVKLEYMPTVQKVIHLQSENLQDLLDVQYELLKYRLGDEIFILKDLNLASLVKIQSSQIIELANSLAKWNLIYVLAGRGKFANDKISYQEQDINDLVKELQKDNLNKESPINEQDILNAINDSTAFPWRTRLKGAFQDIFFITEFNSITKYVSLVEKMAQENLGVYIQPLNQGTSYHCEFDLFYDPRDESVIPGIKQNYIDISSKLMESGAFFNRPYSLWAKEAFANHSENTITALKKVKKIFDPNNVLNPGVLCFDDEMDQKNQKKVSKDAFKP